MRGDNPRRVIKLRTEIERLYEDERGILRVLARVASESTPGVWYGVYLWIQDGKVVAAHCTCPGYTFRKQCKHIERVKNTALNRALPRP
jgi:uncharacterized Zn finger protein